jgi:NAD(P)-dependent dehydrogenase (short-subunit alcohol dehydrogenase family)
MKKSILLTGATGNLGAEISRKLQASAYQIYAPIRIGSHVESSTHFQAVELDIMDEKACKAWVEHLKSQHSLIRAGIFTVGAFEGGSLAETTASSLEKMFQLNFESTFFLAKELFQYFESIGGGQLFFIGARPAIEPNEGKDFVAYSLSKSLLFSLADLINAEGKDKNISATVIVPSTIDTPATRKASPEADYGLWVKPENIADLITFLLSDSGQMLSTSNSSY